MLSITPVRAAPVALLSVLALSAPIASWAYPTEWGPTIAVGGVGNEGDGAGIAIGAIGGGSRPDMVLMAYDDPSGGNEFRYRVGFDLDSGGVAARWGAAIKVPGVGDSGEGAGVALADLDGNGRPDMILMAYDAPSGANGFRYRVGRNMNASGLAQSWSGYISVPGVGNAGDGADLAIADLDGNGRPDMILMAYDDPSGGNEFRYRIGRNLDAAGRATGGWSDWVRLPGVGAAGQGAGLVVGNLDGDGSPDILAMAYDAPAGANGFRYRVGYGLETDGSVEHYSPMLKVAGAGWEGAGAGAAMADLDGDGRAELIFMAYDDPRGGNEFRYRIGRDWDRNPPEVRMSHTPLLPGRNQMVTFRAAAIDADGVAAVQLHLSDRLARSCSGPVCEHVAGPFPEEVANGYHRCGSVRLSTQRIALSGLRPGAQICARTSDGRRASMQLLAPVGASPGRLQLAYTVWSDAGGAPRVHRRGTLQVRQTFSGDLDLGRENRAGEDFWFEAETAAQRFITPRGGAAFAVMASSGPVTANAAFADVRYAARARDGEGSPAWTGWRTFGAGAYPGALRPIWYHGDTGDRLDLVFVRDRTSYATEAPFLAALEGTIADGLMGDELMRLNAHRINLWAFRDTGTVDVEDDGFCDWTPPATLATQAAFAESRGIIHADECRDYASGGTFSTEPTSVRTVMHELGHAMFGLADSYGGDGGYWQPSPFPNLYTSLANCRSDAARQGWDAALCNAIMRTSDSASFWRSGTRDLMGSCAGFPNCARPGFNFNHASRRRAVWAFDILP